MWFAPDVNAAIIIVCISKKNETKYEPMLLYYLLLLLLWIHVFLFIKFDDKKEDEKKN